MLAFDLFDYRFSLPTWRDYPPDEREAFVGGFRADHSFGDLTVNDRRLLHQTRARRLLGRPPVSVDGAGGPTQD